MQLRRSLEMTLDEIRSLLDLRDAPGISCAPVNDLLDEHIENVSRRIRELQFLQKQLKSLRSQCKAVHAAKDCEILQRLGNDTDAAPTRLGTHGNGCH
jgi:DNA-binding transcriptional MerR regulator